MARGCRDTALLLAWRQARSSSRSYLAETQVGVETGADFRSWGVASVQQLREEPPPSMQEQQGQVADMV